MIGFPSVFFTKVLHGIATVGHDLGLTLDIYTEVGSRVQKTSIFVAVTFGNSGFRYMLNYVHLYSPAYRAIHAFCVAVLILLQENWAARQLFSSSLSHCTPSRSMPCTHV